MADKPVSPPVPDPVPDDVVVLPDVADPFGAPIPLGPPIIPIPDPDKQDSAPVKAADTTDKP